MATQLALFLNNHLPLEVQTEGNSEECCLCERASHNRLSRSSLTSLVIDMSITISYRRVFVIIDRMSIFGGRGTCNGGGFGRSEAEEESPGPSSVVGINMEWRIVLSQTACNTLVIHPPISESPSSSAILTSTGQRMEKALLFLDRRRIRQTRSLLPRRRRVVFQFRT
jgi:hypothetical protein